MKRHSRLFAGAACLAALVIPACASDGYGPGYGTPDRDQVVLHDGANYSGTAVAINGAVPDLVDYRFNDATSSIVLNYGSWEVCEDANYGGRCEVITASAPDLRGLRLNDNISSLRPAGGYGYPPSTGTPVYGSLVFFSSTGLRGDALTIDRDERDLARAGYNDRARSVDIRSGVWEVCTDGDYRGRCATLDRPVDNLSDIGLSGNISSVRLVTHRSGY
jgi:hypothetical protein